MIKVSIVTVCYNAEVFIRDTIESILQFAFSECEYIIIDGNSKDNTLKIVKEYEVRFREKGINFVVYSERDKGIYDAMNKSLKFCQGDYVMFINAGDLLTNYFYENRLLISNATADVIYGDVYIKGEFDSRLDEARAINLINYSLPFCHQSTLTSRELLSTYPFNMDYRISADYDFFLKVYLKNKTFDYIPVALSVFLSGGVSAKADTNYIKERSKIIWLNHKSISSKLKYIYKFYKALIPISKG